MGRYYCEHCGEHMTANHTCKEIRPHPSNPYLSYLWFLVLLLLILDLMDTLALRQLRLRIDEQQQRLESLEHSLSILKN